MNYAIFHRSPSSRLALALLGGVGLLAGEAKAQAVELIGDGTLIPGVGNVDDFEDMDINDSGQWVVSGSTDNPDETADGFALESSGVVWQEGQPLPTPNLPGSSLGAFDDVYISNAGKAGYKFFLEPTTPGVDTALLYDGNVLIQEGDDASAVTGTSPGSPWVLLWRVEVNDQNQALVRGSVNDPLIGHNDADGVLTRLQLDPSGSIVSGTPIVRVDDVLPGLTGTTQVRWPIASQHRHAFNNLGDVVFSVFLKNQANGDHAVYSWIGGTYTKLAEEGVPTSFDPTRNWTTVTSGVDLNDSGDTVFRGYMDGDPGTRGVMVLNGSPYLQDGDVLPAIAPFALTGLGSTPEPVLLDNAGNVVWYGRWNDPDTTRSAGVFLNDELLIQKGVSTVDGTVIQELHPWTWGLQLSENGRYMTFRASLVDGREVLALYDLENRPLSFCNGDGGTTPGCTDCVCGNNAAAATVGGCINSRGTSARLTAIGSPEVGNDTLRLEVTGATASSFGILSSADNALPNQGPCAPGSGIQSPVLDGLRCIGGNLLRHGTRATDADGTIGKTTNGWGTPSGPPGGLSANGGFVAGQTRHLQCFYREDALAGCQTGQNTTNGVSITFQ